MQKKRLPKFANVEEEAAFWDEHTPADYFDEKDFKPLEVRVPLDRPITIRLDTPRRKQLEDYADAHSMGDSTAARRLIEEGLARFQRTQQKGLDFEELLSHVWENASAERREELERLARDVSIGNPEDPVGIVATRGQLEAFSRFFLYLLTALGADMVRPGSAKYEALKARSGS